MFAVKSISWRLFHESIATRHEPLHPLYGVGGPFSDSKERVDMVVQDSLANNLFLVEAKTPLVLETLVQYLGEVPIRGVDLTRNSSAGAKILNKACGLCLSRWMLSSD